MWTCSSPWPSTKNPSPSRTSRLPPATRGIFCRRTRPRPVLVVEVAEIRLALDRAHKGSLYARARLPEYWIVNLVDLVLEVHREPEPDAGAPYSWAYPWC